MYSDHAKKRRTGLVAMLVLLVLFGAVIAVIAGRRGDLREESAGAIRAAVQDCALQCYVVEGVYPPSLEYLEQNYGLQVNRDDYYVTYDAFASNLPPTIIVTAK